MAIIRHCLVVYVCSLVVAHAPAATPTFSKDVVPILRAHCIYCHQRAGIASFAEFTSFEKVRPWAKAIKEMVALGRMPPWPADSQNSFPFRNDQRLRAADVATILAWADAGAPKGESDGGFGYRWTASEWSDAAGRPPDLVISMTREAEIPASGDLPYQRFLVKLPITEDKWIEACQARPGNPSVVHHMAITEVELPEGVSPSDVDSLELFVQRMGISRGGSVMNPVVITHSNPTGHDMLAIYTPGTRFERYENDGGKLLKAGPNRYLDFNIHYTPNGRPSVDRSQVAFWFRDSAPKHQMFRVPMSSETIIANGKELLTDALGVRAEGTRMVIPPIPPASPDYELIAITAFTQPTTIYQFQPHGHLRAKDFKYQVVYPDGREKALLTVPRYDFRWQLAYELENPLKLPAASKLVVVAHFDNSPNNRFNPAPNKEVYFRSQNQSTDEMFSPFVQYSDDLQLPNKPKLPIVETVGCLVPSRQKYGWLLNNASAPFLVEEQATSGSHLEKVRDVHLGSSKFQLVGLSFFEPSKHVWERVAVRGVLANARSKHLNVTSLQGLSERCGK